MGIDLSTFKRMLDRASKMDFGRHDYLKIASFLVILYWTGLRKTEVIGARPHRYTLPPCKRHKEPIQKTTDAVRGIIKEDIWMEQDFLMVKAIARKHGKREAPLMIHFNFPFVDLILKQWNRTKKGQRIWEFSEYSSWEVMKKIEPKGYLHFFRFNRITELCKNPEMSVAEICSWTGLTPQMIGEYMERSGRLVRSTAEKMRKQYGQTT